MSTCLKTILHFFDTFWHDSCKANAFKHARIMPTNFSEPFAQSAKGFLQEVCQGKRCQFFAQDVQSTLGKKMTFACAKKCTCAFYFVSKKKPHRQKAVGRGFPPTPSEVGDGDGGCCVKLDPISIQPQVGGNVSPFDSGSTVATLVSTRPEGTEPTDRLAL